MIIQFFTVFFTAMFEIWVAIPIGIGFKLNPIITIIATFLGASAGSVLVILLGNGIQKLILRGHNQKIEKETTMKKIWNKYGVIGLGLLSPLLTGAPLGIAIGLLFNAEKKKLLIFVVLGILIWSIVFTLIGVYSYETFQYFIKHSK